MPMTTGAWLWQCCVMITAGLQVEGVLWKWRFAMPVPAWGARDLVLLCPAWAGNPSAAS